MQIKKGMPQGLAATISELTDIARLSPIDVLVRLKSPQEGLDQREVEERLLNYGLNNAACEAGWDRIWHYFERLRNDLLLPVLAAAMILIFIGKAGTGCVIAAVLFASVFLSLVLPIVPEKTSKNSGARLALPPRFTEKIMGRIGQPKWTRR